VKLLAIDIDYQLNFDAHISTICRKASHKWDLSQSAVENRFSNDYMSSEGVTDAERDEE
jgi:hypothetical protein